MDAQMQMMQDASCNEREREESRRKRTPARIRTGRIALQRMNAQLMPDAMRLERGAVMPTCGLATNMM